MTTDGSAEAKSAYSDLLTLWKNADPDGPVVKEARAEYARLPLAAHSSTELSRVAPVRDRTGLAVARFSLRQ